MKDRENRLRAARFERPERIPISFGLNASCYAHYPLGALDELEAEHPLLLPGFKKPVQPSRPGPDDFAPHRRAEQAYTDSWGCVWETSENGPPAHPAARTAWADR